jgi:6-pyruvoyltetrahydropterin 2'-reductase
MKNHLIVSEDFYSIQGEGLAAGTPAVFLRLAGCNLNCEFCDTRHAWISGKEYSFQQIITKWQNKLLTSTHLIITVGEPVLQQEELVAFINQLDEITVPYIELETNASILLKNNFLHRIDQINASPKLLNEQVILQLAKLNKTKFKFVIAKKQDIHEVLNKYIAPFNINPQNVWLMPEANTKDALHKKSPMVIELCKKYSLNFSPRLQLDLGIR